MLWDVVCQDIVHGIPVRLLWPSLLGGHMVPRCCQLLGILSIWRGIWCLILDVLNLKWPPLHSVLHHLVPPVVVWWSLLHELPFLCILSAWWHGTPGGFSSIWVFSVCKPVIRPFPGFWRGHIALVQVWILDGLSEYGFLLTILGFLPSTMASPGFGPSPWHIAQPFIG